MHSFFFRFLLLYQAEKVNAHKFLIPNFALIPIRATIVEVLPEIFVVKLANLIVDFDILMAFILFQTKKYTNGFAFFAQFLYFEPLIRIINRKINRKWTFIILHIIQQFILKSPQKKILKNNAK